MRKLVLIGLLVCVAVVSGMAKQVVIADEYPMNRFKIVYDFGNNECLNTRLHNLTTNTYDMANNVNSKILEDNGHYLIMKTYGIKYLYFNEYDDCAKYQKQRTGVK